MVHKEMVGFRWIGELIIGAGKTIEQENFSTIKLEDTRALIRLKSPLFRKLEDTNDHIGMKQE